MFINCILGDWHVLLLELENRNALFESVNILILLLYNTFILFISALT